MHGGRRPRISLCSAAISACVFGCDPPAPPIADAGAPISATASSTTSGRRYDPDWRSPAPMALEATIDTSLGELRCALFADKAPKTVASFAALANGTRPWKSREGFVKRPAYDGTVFHQVVPGQLVVGGRPLGAAPDTPGYRLEEESWPGMRHDRAGLLCRGARGVEWLVTLGPMPRLDAAASDAGAGRPVFTVFGACKPRALLDKLGAVPTERGRPRAPLRIRRLRVAPSFSTGK